MNKPLLNNAADNNSLLGANNNHDHADNASFVFIPTNKLDADQYSAEDLDGVTESLFGSGGLSYASLQASQTDATLLDTSLINALNTLQDAHAASHAPVTNASFSPIDASNGSAPISNTQQEEQTIAPSDNDAGKLTTQNLQGNEGNTITDSALGAAQASNAGLSSAGGSSNNSASNSQSNSSSTSNSTSNTQTTITGTVQGRDGTDGSDGVDATTQEGEDSATIIHNTTTTYNETTNITNNNYNENTTNNVSNELIDLGDTLGDLTVIVGDVTTILNNLLSTLDISHLLDVSNVTNLITDVTQNVTGLVEQVVTEIVNITDSLTNLVQSLDLGDLNIQQLLGDKLNIIEELVGGTLNLLGDKTELLQEVIGGLTDKLGDLPNIGDALGMVGHLQEVTGIIEEVTQLVLHNPVVDTLTNALDGLLGGSNNGDTDIALGADISVLNIPIIDDALAAPLDLAEDLLGDVDLGLGLGLDLLGDNETSNAEGDTDLVLETGIDLIDDGVLGGALEVGLDPIEALVGDIDLDINLAGNLLGGNAPNLLDNMAGGSGDNNLLTELQNVGGDVVGNLTDMVAGDGLLGGLLNNNADAGNDTGGGDLLVDLELDALGIQGLDIEIEDPFGLVGSLTGDLDIGIDADIDLLGNGGELLDSDLSLGDISLPQVNDLLDNIGGMGGQDMLPDPIGNLTGGLGAIVTQPIVPIRLGGFHGGLFG